MADQSKQVQEILRLIKEEREKQGLSQRQLAQALGLSQNGYKNIEIGKTDLKLEMLLRIMEALNIDNDLFSDRKGARGNESTYLPAKVETLEHLYQFVSAKLATKEELGELKGRLDNIESMLRQLLNQQTGNKDEEE